MNLVTFQNGHLSEAAVLFHISRPGSRSLKICNRLLSQFTLQIHTNLVSLSVERIPGTPAAFTCCFVYLQHRLLYGPPSPTPLVLMFDSEI